MIYSDFWLPKCGYEFGDVVGAFGFYCEVGCVEEVGDFKEVLVGIGVGCGDGGGGV